jgi:hypothetical protein
MPDPECFCGLCSRPEFGKFTMFRTRAELHAHYRARHADRTSPEDDPRGTNPSPASRGTWII